MLTDLALNHALTHHQGAINDFDDIQKSDVSWALFQSKAPLDAAVRPDDAGSCQLLQDL